MALRVALVSDWYLPRLGGIELFLNDLAVRLGGAGLEYEALHPEDYVFVARPGIRVTGPDDAPELALLDAGPELPLFRYFLDARPPGEVWRFGGTELLGAIGAIRLRALEGAGVAVLPTYFVAEDLRSGALAPLLPDTRPHSDAFRLVWRSGHPRDGELRALAAELRAIPLR